MHLVPFETRLIEFLFGYLNATLLERFFNSPKLQLVVRRTRNRKVAVYPAGGLFRCLEIPSNVQAGQSGTTPTIIRRTDTEEMGMMLRRTGKLGVCIMLLSNFEVNPKAD